MFENSFSVTRQKNLVVGNSAHMRPCLIRVYDSRRESTGWTEVGPRRVRCPSSTRKGYVETKDRGLARFSYRPLDLTDDELKNAIERAR
ncbi:MAG: hypothetical protein QOG10_5843 [Kribbellaceae bacterium]|jgi:hypothetical protein|nr:hypothetical protein [Kribbellaceae bacterium]